MGDVKDKKIVIQGVGNVGRPLIGFLLEKGVGQIVAGDVNPDMIEMARREYQGISNVEILHTTTEEQCHELWKTKCDVLSPCAYGAVLNEETIPHINATVVCGAANNQLHDPHTHGELMEEKGLVYVPDFVANRMGIVNCANEQYGRVGSLDQLVDPAITRHLDPEYEEGVYQTTRRVLRKAKEDQISTSKAADILADEALQKPHPIWGHRSQEIIDRLVKEDWHLQAL